MLSKRFDKFFKETNERLSLDRRFSVFDYNLVKIKDKNLLEIRISDKKIAKSVKKIFGLFFGSQGISGWRIRLLPDPQKIPGKYGIGNSGFTPVYHSSTNRSEAVTQILLGETCLILDLSEDKNWLLIKMLRDGYIGWASKYSIQCISEPEFKKWQKTKKVLFVNKIIEIKEKPNFNSQTLRIGFINSALPVLRRQNTWMALLLPDNSVGWVPKNSISENITPRPQSAEKILETAKIFLGSSYLWSGRTPLGIDCSGFVQTVFYLNGYDLPRDSGLQFKCGVDSGKDFSALKAGDLLFFGKSRNDISHVAIYTGEGMKFIHSSVYVHYGSLDDKNKLFDKRLKAIFVGARRIINT